MLEGLIQLRFCHHRDLADAYRDDEPSSWYRNKCPSLLYRPRLPPTSRDAPIASRRQFINELKAELPQALKRMQHGSIAPVDFAQASIGPGMAIYSSYSKVMEADGTPIRVRTALQLINRALDEVLAEQEGESDVETRWAIAWFETYAMDEGPYGQAETLSKAKNTAIQTSGRCWYFRGQGWQGAFAQT